MSIIKDLSITSISDMNQDEAIEHLRQIRLSRRIPIKKVRSKSKAEKTPKVTKMTKNQAAELLKLLSK